MGGDLLVITPTRGRYDSAVRLAKACEATCTARTRLLLCVDDDDPSYDAGIDGAVIIRGPRKTCGQWTNQAVKDYAAGYTAVASLGDDHEPETPGWDTRMLDVINAMPAGIGIAYGDDRAQGADLPTAPVMSSAIPLALGWMFLDWHGRTVRYFADDTWKALGEKTWCLAYLPDVIIRHYHPAFGTADIDQTYIEAAPGWDEDQDLYRLWRASRDGLHAAAAAITDLRTR